MESVYKCPQCGERLPDPVRVLFDDSNCRRVSCEATRCGTCGRVWVLHPFDGIEQPRPEYWVELNKLFDQLTDDTSL